jgi:hypothetical protein
MRETANSLRYYFADFTRENYARLVDLARTRFEFHTYCDYASGPRVVFWRHDLDFSVHAAAKLAEIEAQKGVIATYFFLMHSEFYNLLERECVEVCRSIVALGHRVGLHFDHRFWRIREERNLVNAVHFEKELLERILDRPVDALSFHIPDDVSESFQEDRYAGLVNTYSTYFRTRVEYCSDSNGYWRYRRLEDVLREPTDSCLQVLTHPEYWQDSVMSPRERVERCIQGRADKVRKWYRDVLRTSGREDIDW